MLGMTLGAARWQKLLPALLAALAVLLYAGSSGSFRFGGEDEDSGFGGTGAMPGSGLGGTGLKPWLGDAGEVRIHPQADAVPIGERIVEAEIPRMAAPEPVRAAAGHRERPGIRRQPPRGSIDHRFHPDPPAARRVDLSAHRGKRRGLFAAGGGARQCPGGGANTGTPNSRAAIGGAVRAGIAIRNAGRFSGGRGCGRCGAIHRGKRTRRRQILGRIDRTSRREPASPGETRNRILGSGGGARRGPAAPAHPPPGTAPGAARPHRAATGCIAATGSAHAFLRH